MLQMYVSGVSAILKVCCNCFFMDVAKVDEGVTHVVYVASVLEACCKCFFEMFHLF
jgi:hypothetical protein